MSAHMSAFDVTNAKSKQRRRTVKVVDDTRLRRLRSTLPVFLDYVLWDEVGQNTSARDLETSKLAPRHQPKAC